MTDTLLAPRHFRKLRLTESGYRSWAKRHPPHGQEDTFSAMMRRIYTNAFAKSIECETSFV